MAASEPQAGGPSGQVALARLGIAIDRDADVPIGVQIGWVIRARIGDGTLRPGQRLPGLRDLANATAVNINTVRAVYQRLEHDGLVKSRHGSGTFVTSAEDGSATAGTIAASAAREAHESGIDPRAVAAALYVAPASASPDDHDAARRRALRTQIRVLTLAIDEIEARRPRVPAEAKPARAGAGPRLLGVAELEQVRDDLLRQIAALQQDIGAPQPTDRNPKQSAKEPNTADVPAGAAAAKKKRRARATTRPAPASG
jgi:DNA-binding transcriptional regulator YhcF (GntR family)